MIKLGNNNIGKIYLGSNSIGRAYLGSNLVFQKGSSPTPAVTIPYIRGGADGSYIDTGITADNTTRVVVWARNVNPGCTFFFGSRIAYQDSSFALVVEGANEAGRVRVDYGNTIYKADNQLSKLSDYHKYELDKGTLKIDDITIYTVTSSSFNNNKNIHLFGMNNNGTHSSSSSSIDICAAKIFKGDVLVRDYVAVNGGLYDSISATLFTNAGSGSLTYGSFNQAGYTRLEYVECSGAQYFDSGEKGGYAKGICCICKPTPTVAHMYDILGVANSSTGSCRFTLGEANSLCKTLYYGLGSSISANTIYDSASPNLSNRILTIVKLSGENKARVVENYIQIGNEATGGTAADTFQTGSTMYVGGVRDFDLTSRAFIGVFYYVSIGTNVNFVPALVNNIAGMYDTYNDVFHASETNTPFIAGPTI